MANRGYELKLPGTPAKKEGAQRKHGGSRREHHRRLRVMKNRPAPPQREAVYAADPSACEDPSSQEPEKAMPGSRRRVVALRPSRALDGLEQCAGVEVHASARQAVGDAESAAGADGRWRRRFRGVCVRRVPATGGLPSVRRRCRQAGRGFGEMEPGCWAILIAAMRRTVLGG